jgi:triacylglycerol lipase
MAKIVQDVGEEPLVLHSNVRGPLKELSLLQRSLVMAELSSISYNDLAESERAAAAIGFPQVTFFDRDGAQAFRFSNPWDSVIACRGTEPTEWNDIAADANATTVVFENLGRVHRGFDREVADLWPMIERAVAENQLPLWFCGHSLGGAMATICAYRCLRSSIPTNPEGLFTYGSPRVGNKQYVNHAKLNHFRWVNNNDIVTRVPPRWLGYRHCGTELYLDRNGRVRHEISKVIRRWDRWRGFIRGLKRWKIDHFTDHSIDCYIEAIVKNLAKRGEAFPED